MPHGLEYERPKSNEDRAAAIAVHQGEGPDRRLARLPIACAIAESASSGGWLVISTRIRCTGADQSNDDRGTMPTGRVTVKITLERG